MSLVGGFVEDGTVFFDSNKNRVFDFVDFNQDGIQDPNEPSEVGGVTNAAGFATFLLPDSLDLNGNGLLDPEDGQYAATSGFDNFTQVSFPGTLTAPIGGDTISALSSIMAELVNRHDFSVDDSDQRVQEAFDLPDVDLLRFHPIFETAAGNVDGPPVLSANTQVEATASQIANLIGNLPNTPDTDYVVGAVFADMADKLAAPGAQLNLGNEIVVETVLIGTADRLGLDLPADVLAGAAQVIAAGNAHIQSLPPTQDEAYLASIAQVQAVLQGSASQQFASVGQGADIAPLVQSNTGQNLETQIASATIGNVLPVAIFSDTPEVTETDSGQTTLTFTVSLSETPAAPITVNYATADGSATEGEDYTGDSGQLTWDAGDDSVREVAITVNGDTGFEGDEILLLNLSDASGGIIFTSSSRGTIVNDDTLRYTAPNTGDPNELLLRVDGDDVLLFRNDEFVLSETLSAPTPIEIIGADGDTALGQLTTSYEYDARGNLKKATYADGAFESWEYDDTFAVLKKYTDPLGRIIEYQIDSLDGNAEYVTQKDTLGNAGGDRRTRYGYTSRPSAIGDLPGGLVTSTKIGVGWNGSTEDNSNASTTTTEYYTSGAKIGLVKETIAAAGTGDASKVQYDYDANRNPTTVTQVISTGNRVVTYAYNAMNQLASVTLPDPGTGDHSAPVTSYTYDAAGNRKSVTDPRSNTTDYEYDEMNRLELTKLPLPGGATDTVQVRAEYENIYDENGNLSATTDHLGRQTDHAYDARNLRTSTTLPDPGSIPGGDPAAPIAHGRPAVYFTYDALGNLKTQSDPRSASIKISYRYDERHRRRRITQPDPGTGDHGAPVTVFDLDAAGQLTAVHAPDPSGTDARVTDYKYDSFGRQYQVIQPADKDGVRPTTTVQFDTRDNRVTRTDAKGRVTTFDHDLLGRVTTITSPAPGNDLGELVTTNTYNEAGDRLTSSISENGGTPRTTTYAYDGIGRQRSITEPDPDGAGPRETAVTILHYDAAGNHTSFEVYAGQTVVDTGTTQHDNLNRPWRELGRPVTVGGQTITPETVTAFDSAGQILATRVKTGLDAQSAPIWLQTDFDHDDLDRLYKVALPAAESGGARPTTYFYYDEAGNERYVRDVKGNLTQTTYDNLNRPKTVTEPSTAQHAAPVTEAVYNIAHEVAQLIDPIGFAGGDTNLYRYVLNSPDNATDPSGESVTVIGGLVGGIVGFFAGGLSAEDGWDWGRAWAGAGSGALVGAGIGLAIDTAGAATPLSKAMIGAGVGGSVGAGVGSAAGGGLLTSRDSVNWAGYGKGAVVGGVTGAAAGASFPTLYAYSGASSSYLGSFAAAAGSGMVGDATAQGVELAVGWSHSYNSGRTAFAGATGGALGVASRGIGQAYRATANHLRARIAPQKPIPRTGPRGVDPAHHNANVAVRDANGKLIRHERLVSGNMTEAEQALGFPKNTLASHTEARAVTHTPLSAGQRMTITGQRPPCPSCKGYMNRATQESGATIIYRWRENGVTRTWTANGG